jgi:glycosyltransferase involved in cell wall biosynthesis
VLYVAPFAPDQNGWGLTRRLFHVLRAYAHVRPVRLLAAAPPTSEAARAELAAICAEVRVVPASPRRHLMASKSTPVPSWIGSSELSNAFEDLAAGSALVHVARLNLVRHLLPALRRLKGHKPLVLDLDEVELDAHSRRRAIAKWFLKPLFSAGRRTIQRYESLALLAFDRVLVASERERSQLSGHGHVLVVKNGTQIPRDLPDEDASSATLLFVGHLGYAPNVDALRFFYADIWPRIRQAEPGARLLIAGRDPVRAVRDLHDGQAVVVDANPPTLTDHYRRAALCVVPLRAGGGTRLKILEAFAFGRAVVSTSLGAEGLATADGRDLLIADQPAQFASACVALLRDPPRRRQLAQSGRRLAEERHGWDSIEASFAAAITELIDGSDHSPSPGR